MELHLVQMCIRDRVMAIVTLTNSSGEEIRIKAEDAMLYECNINEGDKVCFDANNKLEKVK